MDRESLCTRTGRSVAVYREILMAGDARRNSPRIARPTYFLNCSGSRSRRTSKVPEVQCWRSRRRFRRECLAWFVSSSEPPLRHLLEPLCCSRISAGLGVTCGTRMAYARGIREPIPGSSTERSCRDARFLVARSNVCRGLRSRGTVRIETPPPHSAPIQVAVASRPPHLSYRTPQCSQVLDVNGNVKLPR